MRTFFRAALVSLPLLAGCESATSGGDTVAEPRYYGAAGSIPEMGYLVILCPSGDADYVLGGDIVETAGYRRSGHTITLLSSPRVRLTLSADEETLRYSETAPLLRRERQFEGNSCSS